MPNSQTNHIFECCKNGKTKQLLDALESSTEPHIIDERQNSILAVALKNGHWQTAESLIDNNYIYFHVKKPGLIAACQCKKDDSKGIQMVLKLNADINIQDQQHRTALMTVCLLGHVNKAKELFQHNAKVSQQDLHGNTALMDAVQSKNKNMVQLILKQNPEIDQINEQGETALIVELKQKSPVDDTIKQLLEAGSNPELIDNCKKSAWLIAKQKHQKIARLIENHLNKVNQIELPFFSNDYKLSEKPKTDEAIPYQEQEILSEITTPVEETTTSEQLTNTNNDTRIEPSIGTRSIDEPNHDIKPEIDIKTSISTHISNKPSDEVKIKPIINTQNIIEPNTTKPYLFTKKAKISNSQEWFHAAKTGNLGGLNRMIIEGIDIDCVDEKGCTALIRASGHSRRAVVSFLLQQNANIEARSHNGSTALSSSIIGNCRRVAGLLLDKGANVNALGPSDYSYATIAAAQWNDAMLSILYRNGGDIFVLNKSKQTLLHIIALAAEYYNNVNNAKTCIQYLLDHGMDINAQDNSGDTALMVLCGSHKSKFKVDDRNIASIAHCFIKMGAAAAITNKSLKSALDACRYHKLQQTKGVIMNALSWND